MPRRLSALLVALLASACTKPTAYDLVLRNGTIYDGTGQPPYKGDVAVNFDRIVKVGDLGTSQGKKELDVSGLAVAPGFVNMMSGHRRAHR